MLEELKQTVLDANLALVRNGLVVLTWGNDSSIDRERGLVAIKPSGVSYGAMKAKDIVLVELESGRVAEGRLRPSSDTPTHLALYRAWPDIGAVVHTHSTNATAWAQAREAIPCYGTTHADTFRGPIPCVAPLSRKELDEDYEGNTGRSIVEAFAARGINPVHTPGALCACHGPFAWGRNAADAVANAVVLEEVAKMALLTRLANPAAPEAPQYLQEKHFLRKHGPGAYYGQEGNARNQN